jgi:single-strand DNA-binding protein
MNGFEINQLTLSGNLTHDPELRTVSSGDALCRLRIAHNERRKNRAGEWTDVPGFFDITIWGGLGEWVAQNVAKGDKVVVAGRVRWREYETNGTTRQAIDVIADSVVPVYRTTSAQPAPQPAQAAAKKAPAKTKAAA